MATNVTIYRGSNGRYYTPEGLADCMTYGAPPTSYTAVEAVLYNTTFRLMDSAAGTLFSPLGSNTGDAAYVRREDGKQVNYYTKDNAAAEIVVPVYRVNGSAVVVYGAHPSHPGMSGFYSYSSARVTFRTASAAKYSFNGAYTVRGDDLEHVAPNLASGTEYNVDKIVYSNADNHIKIGANAAPADSTFYIYAGYYWFLCLAQNNVTLVTSANSSTRTVANGEKYASITDIPDYNSGSNSSLSVKSSTGSLTFPYRQILRRGLADYLAGHAARTLAAFEGVDAANNTAVVLAGANTQADGSGDYYPVGADIADVLTRNPSLTTYDTRAHLYAFWHHRVAVTVDANGGTGGASAFYYCPENSTFYEDAALSRPLVSIPVPSKPSATLVGLYDGTTKVISTDGEFVAGWTPAADTTLTAHWREVKDIAFSKGDGMGGADGVVYDSEAGGFCRRGSETVITSVITPRLKQWRFLGYYSAATGGTQLIAADGTILPAFVAMGSSAPSTIYAQYQRISYALSLDHHGGVSGNDEIFCDGSNAIFYADSTLENEIVEVEVPQKVGNTFLGYFTGGGSAAQVYGADGRFVPGDYWTNDGEYVNGADLTVYAHWVAVSGANYALTRDPNGGTYKGSTSPIVTTNGLQTGVSYWWDIGAPTRSGYIFTGWYTSPTGGVRVYDENGNSIPGEYWNSGKQYIHEGDLAVYAHWVAASAQKYSITLSPNGGTYNGSSNPTYAADALVVGGEAYNAPGTATRSGYIFTGWYTSPTGGDLRIAADGSLSALPVFASDGGTLFAHWQVRTFTLAFNYAGGAGSTDSKTVTYGVAIGTLPTPSSGPKPDAIFKGWTIGGGAVTAATIWQFDADMTAFAVWETSFGNVEDFFNLGTAALVPIRSSNGDMSPYERPSNAGRYNTGVGTGGGIWRNPSVTYLVVADTFILITFGKAYRGSAGVSGYFITSAQINTSLGAFPTVTVTGTANEGADAINTFHLALSLRARARAQNLMSAIVGGGELHSCSLTASCQPVVLTENMMPCASDVVDGKLSVSASTCAMNGESAPTAGGGFTMRGVPKQSGDTVYTNYDINLEKEMT